MKKAERYIKESELQKIKRYLLYAIAGTIICFVGDWQLGAYMPSQTFAAAGIFPPFSSEWAQAQPARLLLGGLLGSLSLLIMFSGLYAIYLLLRKKQQKTAKCFLLFSFLFSAFGTLYHSVFAYTAYTYNYLTALGIEGAENITLNLFHAEILIAMPAAVGFIGTSVTLFIAAVNVFGKENKKLVFANPLFVMLLFAVLFRLLPKNSITSAVFAWGQQNIGMLVTFLIYYAVRGYNREDNI